MLSVNEKPSIQALERATGYVQTSSGKIVQGLKSTYSGMARSTSSPPWKSPPGSSAARPHRPKSASELFQAFIAEIIADQPYDRQIHVILNNYCTHKKNETWLAAHPNVTFHFTPTWASRLTKFEIWFGIFTRKALSGASFRSAEQLTPGDPRLHRRIQSTGRPVCLAQARGQGLAIATYYR